jgi:hypothetical protein
LGFDFLTAIGVEAVRESPRKCEENDRGSFTKKLGFGPLAAVPSISWGSAPGSKRSHRISAMFENCFDSILRNE